MEHCAGCRRSFSDEPPYRSPLATRAQAMRTHRTESLSDGPNPLLKETRTPVLVDGRRGWRAVGLGSGSTGVGWVTYRVASDRDTGTFEAVGVTTVAVRAGGAAAARGMHNDARVGCPDVRRWPTCWPRTPAAGLGTKGGHQGLVGSNCLTRLSFYPY